jgi:hypothetical protein
MNGKRQNLLAEIIFQNIFLQMYNWSSSGSSFNHECHILQTESHMLQKKKEEKM